MTLRSEKETLLDVFREIYKYRDGLIGKRYLF